MPYRLEWEMRGAFVVFTGDCSAADFRAATEQFSADPRFDTAHYFLWDMSAVDGGESISRQDVTIEAALDKGASMLRPRMKGALVAATPWHRALNDHYIEVCRSVGVPWELKSFDSLDAARRWIET
jgi:hypothetical protein